MASITQIFIFAIVLMSIAEHSEGISMNFGTFDNFRYPFSGRYPFGVGSSIYTRRIPPRGCPVCDSSVFSYCDRKLAHDACCCGDPYYTENSYECQYADCEFLHANSCKESDLIASCCCDEAYKSLNPFNFKLYGKK